MKSFILFLYISLFSFPLLAQRVIVTKTANKNNLNSIYKKLKSLHIKMYVKKQNKYYFIYTKEYQTQHRAELQFKKVQTLFPKAILERRESTVVNMQEKNKRKWIIGFDIGSSSIGGNIDNNTSFSDRGRSYSFKIGYFIKNYFLSTFAYSSSSVKQTTVSNFYLSENYYYDITQNSNIYIGILLGYSRLSMDLDNSTPSGSGMYGLQVGMSYDMFSSIPLSLTYQKIFLKHTISFTSDTQTVDIHTNFQNIVKLGIAYKF